MVVLSIIRWQELKVYGHQNRKPCRVWRLMTGTFKRR